MTENQTQIENEIYLKILCLDNLKGYELIYSIPRHFTIEELKNFISSNIEKPKEKIVLYCREKLCDDKNQIKDFLKTNIKTKEINNKLKFEMCLLKEFYHPDKGIKSK